MEMTMTFPGGARVDAGFGEFVVRTDQPVQGGGEGSAPSPFQLFLASLGTCAGIYVLNFCRQRGLDTRGLRIRQNLEYDPLTAMATQVNLDIDLPAGFPERYGPALIRAAELCAVKKHLESPPRFRVRAHVGIEPEGLDAGN
jgi:ribosomal protein S12 methylthiotransferase accessory factor